MKLLVSSYYKSSKINGFSFAEHRLLKVKEVNGIRRYSLRTDSGVICVPESWTDRQVQQKSNPDSTMIPFDAFTLAELAKLLEAMEEFSEVSSNPIDKNDRER